MKMTTQGLTFALVLASVAAPPAVDAQRRGGDAPDRAQLEQRIRLQMGRMMERRLGLDEEEATRLSAVVQSFDSERRDLARQEFETRRRVEALVETDGDEESALQLLRLQAQLRSQEAQLFRREQDALLEVLSPRQVLELQELRQDLGRRIRELQGGGRSPDSRGPGPRSNRGSNEPRTGGGRPPA